MPFRAVCKTDPRRLARNRVNEAVRLGKMPHCRTLPCADCSGVAQEYDHHLGYDTVNHLAVEAVCKPCHVRRTVTRGEMLSGDRNPSRRRPERLLRGDAWRACHMAALPRGEDNGNAKLTSDAVAKMRALYRLGFTQTELGKMYAVSQAHVSRVVAGTIWRNT